MGTQSELKAEMKKQGWKSYNVKIKHDPKFDREYSEEAQRLRRKYDGRTVVMLDLSNSHGTCIGVWVGGLRSNPEVVYFDPEELSPAES